MATTSEQLPVSVASAHKVPWYLQDLPLYLKGFGISVRNLYRAAFVSRCVRDRLGPGFYRTGFRTILDAVVLH